MKLWIKIAIGVVIVGLFTAVLFAAWRIGELQGSSSASDACNIKLKAKDDAVANDRLNAVNAARDAQKKLDDAALAQEKLETARLTKAVADAKEQFAAVDATNRKLSADYARLKADDTSIQQWGSRCLPDGILGSLHGSAFKAGQQCTR